LKTESFPLSGTNNRISRGPELVVPLTTLNGAGNWEDDPVWGEKAGCLTEGGEGKKFNKTEHLPPLNFLDFFLGDVSERWCGLVLGSSIRWFM